MTDQLHTFCVPAYGESPYLEGCLSSLRQQEIPSEVNVATSTPNRYIEDLSRKYEANYFVTTEPSGIGRDWNFALQTAKTPLVTLAHQDDVYQQKYTKEFLAAYKSYPEAILYFSNLGQLVAGEEVRSNAVIFIKRLLTSPFFVSRKIDSRLLLKLILSFGNPVPCGSVMLNAARLPGDFLFAEDMKTNLDWLAWLTLAREKYGFVRLPDVLYWHRIHPGSATQKTIEKNDRYLEDVLMFEQIWGKKIARLIMAVYKHSHTINNRQAADHKS